MPFTPLTFAQLQAIFATQYSSQASIPANTNAGSTLGAIGNAGALMILNVQNELIYVDGVARASTSVGTDLDSFWAPFNLERYGQTYATGLVTLTTSSPVANGSQVVIPIGGIVTTNGGLQFVIQSDPTNSTGYYSTSFAGYVISGGGSIANVIVQCSIAGTIGNVAASTINQVYNGAGIPVIAGIALTGVNNPNSFVNGAADETDAQFSARATIAISTGVVATDNALIATTLAVQPGLIYSFGDGLNITGGAATATATIVVNVAGSGISAPGSLLTSVSTAVNAIRAAGITVNVIGPTLTAIPVSATIHTPVSTNVTALSAAVIAASNAFINGIGLSPTGGTTECDYFALAAALLAVPGVTKIDSLTVNGGTADVVANFAHQLVAGTTSFTIVQP